MCLAAWEAVEGGWDTGGGACLLWLSTCRASQGVYDMLHHGGGPKILPVIPQLIIPMKSTFNRAVAWSVENDP